MRSLTAASVAAFVALSSVAAFGSDPEEDARSLADKAQSGAASEDAGVTENAGSGDVLGGGAEGNNPQSDEGGVSVTPSASDALAPFISFADPATITPSSGALAGNKEAWLSGPTTRAFAELKFGMSSGVLLGDNGWAYTWGQNSNKIQGNGATDTKLTAALPVLQGQVPQGVTFVQVASGGYTTYALGTNGRVYAWGDNSRGQVGVGTSATPKTEPLEVLLPQGVKIKEISAGYEHALAVTTGGEVYAWGDNLSGQLGTTTTGWSLLPVKLSISGIDSVRASQEYSLALTTDGRILTWGKNTSDILARPCGNQVICSAPAEVTYTSGVPSGVKFTQISTGRDAAYALGTDGLVYAWGNNYYGQLGSGSNVYRGYIARVVQGSIPLGVSITQVAGGISFALALGSDDKIYSWGRDNVGQLGTGTATPADRVAPGNVSRGVMPTGVIPTWIAATPAGLTTGNFGTSAALGSDGRLYTWGSNNWGQAAVGTLDPAIINSPTLSVHIGSNSSKVSFGTKEVNVEQTVTEGGITKLRLMVPPATQAGTVDVSAQWQLIAGSEISGAAYKWRPAKYEYIAGAALDWASPAGSAALPAGSPLVEGAFVDITFNVANTGGTELTNLQADIIGPSIQGGSGDAPDPVAGNCGTDPLAPGAERACTYRHQLSAADVNALRTDGATFIWSATVSADGTDGDGNHQAAATPTAETVSFAYDPSMDINAKAQVTVLPSAVDCSTPDSLPCILDWQITIEAGEEAPLTGGVLTNVVSSEVDVVEASIDNVTLTPRSTRASGETPEQLVYDLGSLGAGESVTVNVVARVTRASNRAHVGYVIGNQAWVVFNELPRPIPAWGTLPTWDADAPTAFGAWTGNTSCDGGTGTAGQCDQVYASVPAGDFTGIALPNSGGKTVLIFIGVAAGIALFATILFRSRARKGAHSL